MPVLNSKRETRTLTLPVSGAEVTVFTKQTYGEYLRIQQATMGQMEVGDKDEKAPKIKADLTMFMAATLEAMIVSWNFTDENGTPVQVNRANLELLDTDDANFLYSEVQGGAGLDQSEDVKKKEANS